MKLSEIISKIDIKKINIDRNEIERQSDLQIFRIEEDRRKIAKNSLLFLDKEEIKDLKKDDVKSLVEEIKEKEVKIIILETGLEDLEKEILEVCKDIIIIYTDNIENAKIRVAIEFYANPEKELKLIGIVGTRGKTTTAFIIREILEKAGIRTGLITTMYTMIEDKIVMQNQGKMPRILDFFKILRVMANEVLCM